MYKLWHTHSLSAMTQTHHLLPMHLDWESMSNIVPPCDLLLTPKGLSLVYPITELVSESLSCPASILLDVS